MWPQTTGATATLRKPPPKPGIKNIRCHSVSPIARFVNHMSFIICKATDTQTILGFCWWASRTVTVSEWKARHDNGIDDTHIIWLRSTYCAYYYPLPTHSSYGLFPASCYNDAHLFLIEDAFTATARSNYVKRSPRGVSPPSARVCVRWASSSRASGPPT